MKVKEKDLVIGDEYYLDRSEKTTGIFVGVFGGNTTFYPTSAVNGYKTSKDGTISLLGVSSNYEYEEVE